MLNVVTPVPRTERSTGVIEFLDLTGDTKVYWDKNNPAEVESARASFETLKSKGYRAFSLSSDGTRGEQVDSFNPSAERILLTRPLAGG